MSLSPLPARQHLHEPQQPGTEVTLPHGTPVSAPPYCGLRQALIPVSHLHSEGLLRNLSSFWTLNSTPIRCVFISFQVCSKQGKALWLFSREVCD